METVDISALADAVPLACPTNGSMETVENVGDVKALPVADPSWLAAATVDRLPLVVAEPLAVADGALIEADARLPETEPLPVAGPSTGDMEIVTNATDVDAAPLDVPAKELVTTVAKRAETALPPVAVPVWDITVTVTREPLADPLTGARPPAAPRGEDASGLAASIRPLR